MVWAKAGGRCAICQKYLLVNALTGEPGFAGELAHIVGWNTSVGSPRGLGADMSVSERQKAHNLILLCRNDHSDIDRDGAATDIEIEHLRRLKADHETWIERITSVGTGRTTVPLIVVGTVHGATVELTLQTAAVAALRNEARFANFSRSYGHAGLEIDLTKLAGEREGSLRYWEDAKALINEVIDGPLTDGVRRGEIRHVSLLAFARTPLLVCLGSRLDDAYEVAVFQRRRDSQSWEWAEGPAIAFAITEPPATDAGEAVLVLNVTGTIQPGELPADLAAFPRFMIDPVSVMPFPDLVSTRQTLLNFEAAVRELLARVEAGHKGIRRLHVMAALPISGAVALGRARDATVHPALLVYHRSDGRYLPALEIQ